MRRAVSFQLIGDLCVVFQDMPIRTPSNGAQCIVTCMPLDHMPSRAVHNTASTGSCKRQFVLLRRSTGLALAD